MDSERSRVRFRVEGIVQGVGFRPFVHAAAGRYALSGLVANDDAGVLIEVEGAADAVRRFRRTLEEEAPPLAVIERVSAEPVPVEGLPYAGFTIAASRGTVDGDPACGTGGEGVAGGRGALVCPDIATCADCTRELFAPADRRFRYPFINCTNCGPRFTVVRGTPYDRIRTTMAEFTMCPACADEYHDPSDRRFHAQPLCCPACGPALRLVDSSGAALHGDPLAGAADLLRAGRILAVKGLGGYHLAVDAGNETAVRALRSRKHRAGKPFAVMVPDLPAAERLCEVDPAGRELLTGVRRPIVLLPRREEAGEAPLAAAVAPGRRDLGLLLPYTPLHRLLSAELTGPYVLTSGNVSDEPLAFRDDDAFARLTGVADAFLTHDRPIHARTDDSVVRVRGGRTIPVRRARGYAPEPLSLTEPAPRPVLGCGAELKNTFCLAGDRTAVLSPHLGDLENHETLRSFVEGVAHFRRLFGIEPALIAHDPHPEYLSSKYAYDLAEETGAELVGVQHHHAHIASCLVDNGMRGPVVGVAFDGLGYGTDGTLWGGEFLVADLCGFRRAAHFVPVPLPGGTAAIREPWRMAVAYLDACGEEYGGREDGLPVRRRHGDRWEKVRAVARSGVNSPLTSSVGRLFDAVAAILGIRDTVDHEGQAAAELEQCADPSVRDAYSVRIDGGRIDGDRIDGADLVRSVVDDLRAGTAAGTIAARFHNSLAHVIVEVSRRLGETTGITVVALSGGVFQNALLVDRTVPALRRHGFEVLTHRRVPPNDGGISLGQVAVAAALDAAGALGPASS
ncbi:carbamoyltransferase HypF [Streptomyces poonensis]|uniref:Carbamoyltransferase n=1 Tax=Streptomyces poonensis TaxID=68255 RepID=A0A918UG97_9ACTN|nr:carbamoyltransferase HypF [Streptomyces poonensis]GGZ03784.1 carbamoyltransferase [Streptomyces poonensis]GLJ90775.1 carbamoyltransferase [Streptomyces poonensis]